MAHQKIEIADISAKHTLARDAVDHAIAELSTLLAKSRFTVGKGPTKIYLELRRDLPYMIHETSSLEVRILVNRNYKPLGNPSKTGDDWVNYDTTTNMHVWLTNEQIQAVLSPGQEHGLFGDGDPPWWGRKEASKYLTRLKILRSML